MKIGITCYPTYGGSGAIATELGIALAARGHEVHFITYQQPFRLPAFLPRIYFHEVDVGRYPLFEYPPYDLALAVRMHEVVLRHGLDLLHLHYAIPHATSAWIAREMLRQTGSDVRLITTLHGTDITIVGQDPSFHAITKFSIEKSDRLTAVSRYLQRETYTAFGCTACQVDVIYNFIDPQLYDRRRYAHVLPGAMNGGRAVLIHVSNFRAVKRVRDIIRIFAKGAGIAAQRPRHGGGWPRPRGGAGRSTHAGCGGRRLVSRQARGGRAAAGRRRSVSAAERDRIIRAQRARSAGDRRTRRGHARRRAP